MRKKILVLIALCFALLCGVNISYAADGGSFVISATSSDKVVIEPCRISWTDGQTIRDALKSSGHEFEGIDEDWITAIDGNADNYMRYYNNGEYGLDAPASSVNTALVFTTVEMNDSDSYRELARMLCDHSTLGTEIKNFPAVMNAYSKTMKNLPAYDNEKAATAAAELQKAYNDYYKWAEGKKTSVTISAKQQDQSCSTDVYITDSMGNAYEASGNPAEFQLPSEEYTFTATKGNCKVTGTFTVNEEDSKNIDVKIPYGNWINTICISDSNNNRQPCNPGEATSDFVISDFTISPYINITPADSISENAGDYVLYCDYTGYSNGRNYGDENNVNNVIPWDSSSKKLVQLSSPGIDDREADIKVVHEDENTGFVQRQYYHIRVKNMPTLSNLEVSDMDNLLDLSPDFAPTEKQYSVDTLGDSLTVNAEPFSENCTVEVKGNDSDNIEIKVTAENGIENCYSVSVNRKDARTIEVTKPSENISVTLKKSNGSRIRPVSDQADKAIFHVIPGKYEWVTTIDEDYHAKGSVDASETDEETIHVDGVMPDIGKLLTGINAYSGSNSSAVEYETEEKSFDWNKHEYTYLISDIADTFYLRCTAENGVSVTRGAYTATDGSKKKAAAFSTSTKTLVPRFISASNKNNSLTLTAYRKKGEIEFYQDYTLSTKRLPSLANIECSDASMEFDSDETEYSIDVDERTENLQLTVTFDENEDEDDQPEEKTLNIGDSKYSRNSDGNVIIHKLKLTGNSEKEVVELKVRNGADNPSRTYRITINKVPPVEVSFCLDPAEGNVYLTNCTTGNDLTPDADGRYSLLTGYKYTYTATAFGYVGKQETFTAGEAGTVNISLEKAKENSELDTSIEAEWPYFRADENNNGVVDAAIPARAEDAVLYWATQIGEGYSSNAAGCPILADGFIYSYSGKAIVKMDPMTGKIVATGEMDRASSFAINSPTYAEGMIFVGLSNGGVQAFNAKTLESVWIYNDRLGGQPNCQITYKNGYIYTGFWNSETKDADLVCLSVTDEIPEEPKEEKLATWIHQDAGFYWAGAFASEDFVVVGTDDGKAGYTSGTGSLISVNPRTGQVIDEIDDEFDGDIRSSICYDTESGRYCFTTKAGLFCTVKITSDGMFVKDSITKLQLKTTGGQNGMSTSTPVIYNGRAYVGVSGTGQFTQYSGHNITVIDVSGIEPEIAYLVPTQGYPQTSGLLTTAYDEGDGTVYVYFFDNFTPGKLRVIIDRPGITEPDKGSLETEEYTEQGNDKIIDTAASLFTPFGDQAQYAICSPVADEWGNLYFKNDSAFMMMVGAKITKLEVIEKPCRIEYEPGDIFDGTGMKVKATYVNGKVRDVSKYVNYTKEPLTEDDTEIDIFFDIGDNMKLYHNGENGPGTDFIPPQTSISIKVNDHRHIWIPITIKAAYCRDGKTYESCSVCKATRNENVITGLGPAGISLKSIKKGKKKFTAKWKKPSKTKLNKMTGYQIRYSLNSNMSGSKTVSASKKKTSVAVKKLVSKRKYYVQIRTYVKSGSRLFYSGWSGMKTVTVK